MNEAREDYLREVKVAKKFFKLCLVGDGATGKTTFMRYMATGDLVVCHQDLRRTPYMDFGSTKLEDKTVQIIDLAGQRFDDAHPLDHIPVAALKSADLILFFFSLENFESFLSIQNWFSEIKGVFEGWGTELPICILVGNKNDLTRCVEGINGVEFVKNNPEFRFYVEISMLTGHSVIELVKRVQAIMDERSS